MHCKKYRASVIKKKISYKINRRILALKDGRALKKKTDEKEFDIFLILKKGLNGNIFDFEEIVRGIRNDAQYLNMLEIAAEKILAGKIQYLGISQYKGREFRWNEDIKTQYIWENQYYQRIKTVSLDNDSDVKRPWEYARLQHLITIGLAFYLTKKNKYAEYFKNEMYDWRKNNPYKYSVNWTCAMEVAIRAVNLIAAGELFRSASCLDKDFWNHYDQELYLHFKFIIQNLETYDEYYNNHYLADLLGILWLSVYFELHYKDSRRKGRLSDWGQYAWGKLAVELDRQVWEDGTDYETSTSYHKLVTEIYIWSIYIAKRSKMFAVSKHILRKVEKMCEFLHDILKDNGNLPVIGDADDGRILIFEDYYTWNRKAADYILTHYEECLAGTFYLHSDIEKKNILKKSKKFQQGGYYLLRSNDVYCIVRCGELSLHGHGGHSHNDQLSIELSIKGKDIFVDPGVGEYTGSPATRNHFRRTAAHNTVAAEGLEQNTIQERRLFELQEESFGHCLEFQETKFIGEHFGYKKHGLIHKRIIECAHEQIVITDGIGRSMRETPKVYTTFQLDPEVKIRQVSENICLLTADTLELRFESSVPVCVVNGEVSPSYGVIIPALKIEALAGNYEKIITTLKFGGRDETIDC